MNAKIVSMLFCGYMASVCAADSTAGNPLSLDEAILRVLENHPKLRIADLEAQAMASRMRQALLSPADRVNLDLEDIAGTGYASGVKGVETTLSLSRTLELGGKAERRGVVVQEETNLLLNEKDIDRLDLLAETARRFLRVVADQKRLRLTEEALDLIRLTEQSVEDRIRAGKTPAAERERVIMDLANFDVELDHRRHELEVSRLSLATLWNERLVDFPEAEGDIFRLDAMPEFESLADLIDRNPDIARHIRAEDLAQARIGLARSKRHPDLELSAGLRYLGNYDDVALVFSASVPLGGGNRARHGIDEAEALARVEPLNLEQRRLELHATLFGIYQEMKHARDAAEALRQQIIPAAERLLAGYQTGYQAGRYSLLELIQTRQTLHNARAQAIEMAVEFHACRIEIDRLTGAMLDRR